MITTEVLDEIARGIVAGHEFLLPIHAALGSKGWRQRPLKETERPRFLALLRNLGPSEASSIAVAEAIGGIVATDDRLARSVCAEFGVQTTGTLGILLAACRDGALTAPAADDILQEMIKGGFYSPVHHLRDVL